LLAKRPGSLAGDAALPASQGGNEGGLEPSASADHPGTASAVPCIAGLSARAEQLLIGASVYREPADANAVVFHLGEHDWTAARAPDRRGPAPPYQPPPDLHELLAACTASGLLHAVARGQTGQPECWQVDPWVAGELHRQLGAAGRPTVLIAAHRRAAEYWQWRAAAWPQDRRSDLHDLLEARHHLFLAGDAEQASELTRAVCAQLHAWGDLGREAELIHATLEMLPTRSSSRANWMHELGTIYQVRAEFGEAYRCYAGAVQMFALLGDFDGVSRGQHSLGVLAQAQGDYRRAERHYKRSSAAERRAGQRPGGPMESAELTEGPVFKQAVPDLAPVTPPPAGPGQRTGAPSPAARPGQPPAVAGTPAAQSFAVPLPPSGSVPPAPVRAARADGPASRSPATTRVSRTRATPAASQATANRPAPATARAANGALAPPQPRATAPVPHGAAISAAAGREFSPMTSAPATPVSTNGLPAAAPSRVPAATPVSTNGLPAAAPSRVPATTPASTNGVHAAAAPLAPVRPATPPPGGAQATATIPALAPATAATARAASNGVTAPASAPRALAIAPGFPARAPRTPTPATPEAAATAAAAATATAAAPAAGPATTSPVIRAGVPADAPGSARAEPGPADQTAAGTGHTASSPLPRRVTRRPSLVLRAVIAVGLAALSAVGISAALARTADQHAGSGQGGGGQATPPAVRSIGAVRAEAAAWVVAQVSSSAVVACDPAECAALHQRGLPAGDLLVLGPGGPADPLASDVIVVTAAVRAEFGARLTDVYAPAVLASFGTGATGIQVRLIAADGTAAYRRAALADFVVRRRFGAEMLHNAHLIVSGQARQVLAAGSVDSRLLAMLATLADIQNLRVLSFGDAGPRASRWVPLRSAEIAAPPGAAASWLRTALRFFATQQDPFQPSLTAMAHPAGAGRALLIEYPSPSPLGLLEASGATPGA
jgi:hypothetical protein